MSLNSVKSLPKAPEKGLPVAAVEFAKKMGIDITGMEAEAQDMWRMLEDMSVNDPIAYSKFIQENLDKDNIESISNSTKGTEDNNKSSEGKHFRPKAGFSVEMRTCGGDDGIKIRDISSKSTSGKQIYINMCSHEALEPPKDINTGKVLSLDKNRTSADGMELPLAIGKLRNFKSRNENHITNINKSKDELEDMSCLICDVVVHPYIITQCLSNSQFLTQVIGLVTQWVQEERNIVIESYQTANTKMNPNNYWEILPTGSTADVSYTSRNRKGTKLTACYVGGRGDNEDIPALFAVDDVTGVGASETDADSSSNLNPSSIVQHVKREKMNDEVCTDNLMNIFTSNDRKNDANAGSVTDIQMPFSMTSKSDKNISKPKDIKQTPMVVEVGNETDKCQSSNVNKNSILVEDIETEKPKLQRKPKAQPSIKKGFLNKASNKGVLYGEEGSSEGAGAAKGGK